MTKIKVYEVVFFKDKYNDREIRKIDAYNEEDARDKAMQSKKELLKRDDWEQYTEVTACFAEWR